MAAYLHMTVARLRLEMGNGEFLAWCVYLARQGQKAEVARGGGG